VRHQFASKLAIVGVDLTTVGELPPQDVITMALPYAGAAPEPKADGVAKIDDGAKTFAHSQTDEG